MTARHVPMEFEQARAQQLACIQHDINTIRGYADRCNAIIGLMHFELPPIDLPQLRELEQKVMALRES